MLRKLSVPLFVAFVISGCNCNDEPAPEQSVTITAPKSGATLTMKDDTANDVDGLQIAVTATIAGFGTDAKATLSVNGTAGTPIDALTASLTFPGVTLQEGANVLKVEVTDSNGTKDAVVSVTADLTVVSCTVELIDPVPIPPAVDVVLNKSKSLAGSGMQLKAKVKTAGCVGGIIRVCAQADGATGTSCEKAGGKLVGEAPLSTTNVTDVLITLPEGQMTLAAEHKANDGTVNASAATNVTVDTVVPTCEFVAPAENAELQNQTTQVQVRCTDAEVDQPVTVISNLQSAPTTAKMTTDGLVTLIMALEPGLQTLTAQVTDKAGNQSAPVTRSVTVVIDGCDTVPSAPIGGTLSLNLANGNVTGTPPKGSFVFKGSSKRCPDGTVRITRTINGVETELASVPLSDGTYSKAIDFDDGECGGTITVKVEKAGWQANAGVSVNYSTDFTPPILDSITPPLGNLFVINDSNPNKGQPGYVVDVDPDQGGGQVAVELDVTGAGDVCGARAGNVRIVAGTKELLNESSADNAPQVLARTITLDEGLSGPVNIVLKDAADNVVTAKWDAKVSTLPLPVLKITNPPAGTINVAKDLGGDRATYAQVSAVVTYTGTLPPGSVLALCTNLPGPKTGSACSSTGFVEILGTRTGATGASQFYSSIQLGQGAQRILAEMADAVGSVTASPEVALVVDTKPPRVTKVECTEDANKDGILSGAELPIGQAAHVEATFLDVEDGQMAVLFDGPTNIATASVASGAATFTVSTLADGAHALRVTISDKAGNPNTSKSVSPEIANPEAEYALSVQRVAPSISRVAPSFDTCNKARDADPASPNTCELDFTVLVGTSATRVDFSVVPSTAASITPASVTSFVAGQATARYGMIQSTTPAQIIATAYDAAGNARQASFEIKAVDTIPPTISFVSPIQNQVLFLQTFPVVLATDAEVGQTAVVKSLASNTDVGQGFVVAGSPSNTASFNVSLSGANQDLSATVNDLAGNPSVPAIVSIQMNLAGCDINFTYPTTANPIFNLANAPGGVVEIKGYSSLAGCGNKQINFTAAVDGGTATSIGSTTTDATGNFTFSHTFGDGTLTVLTARSSASGSAPNGFSAITDITPPTLQITTPVPDTNSKLYLVAQTGNIHVKAGTPGFVAEMDNTALGGQLAVSLTATGAGPSAGTGQGSVRVLEGPHLVYEQPINSNVATVVEEVLTLTQAFWGPLSFSVTDYAGNTASTVWTATVDIAPPPPPQLVSSDPGTGLFTHVSNERAATIDVYWTVPSDDGPTPNAMVWDFGFAKTTALTGAPDDLQFDNPAITTKKMIGAVGPAGSVSGTQLAVAPLNTYTVMPRIIDGAGNRSPLAASQIPVLWRTSTLSYSGTSTLAPRFGSTLATGADLNGDTKPDFAVSAPFAGSSAIPDSGEVLLYAGGSIPPSLIQTLSGVGSYKYFGTLLSLTDIVGDSKPDLVVGEDTGRAFVFSGTATGVDPTPAFTISGPRGFTSVSTISDLNADGRRELVLGCGGHSSNLGAVFIFFSRTDWSGLIVGGIVDVSKADRTIIGTDTGGRLGFGAALKGYSDIDGDGAPDLLVGAPVAKKLYLFSGTQIASATASIPASAGIALTYGGTNSFPYSSAVIDVTGDGLLDILAGEILGGALYAFPRVGPSFATPATTPWTTGGAGFSRPALSADLNSDSSTDLIVSAAGSGPGSVNIFFSKPSTPLPPSPGATLAGGNGFGASIGMMDVNGDGNLDLLVGENQGYGSVSIVY